MSRHLAAARAALDAALVSEKAALDAARRSRDAFPYGTGTNEALAEAARHAAEAAQRAAMAWTAWAAEAAAEGDPEVCEYAGLAQAAALRAGLVVWAVATDSEPAPATPTLD